MGPQIVGYNWVTNTSGERNGNLLQQSAWKMPWTEEPDGLYSPWGCKGSYMTE